MSKTIDDDNATNHNEYWQPTKPPRESKIPTHKKVWNWRRNVLLNPANYYEASLPSWQNFDKVSQDQTYDVVVVGAGLLGLSTALFLSRLGLEVAVVDSKCVGSGASGRNGGQLTPGLARWEAETMLNHFDFESAKHLWKLTAQEAMALLDELIDEFRIQCERKMGHITACVHPCHVKALEHGVIARRKLGDHSAKIIDRELLRSYVNSTLYHGGVYDDIGGQLHPLALTRGLADALIKSGGVIYENTRVEDIIPAEKGAQVHTIGGILKARKSVVVAAHYHTQNLMKKNKNTAFPFHTYIGVTEPLKMPVDLLMPGDKPVYDTQIQIDYYRAVRENRLLFGGEGTGSCLSVNKVKSYLSKRLRTVFPALGETEFEFLWSGTSDITVNGALMCHIDNARQPIYYIHGWSGHGVAQTIRIGKSVADHIYGKQHDFELLHSIYHKNYFGLPKIGGAFVPMIKFGLKLRQKFRPEDLVSF